MKHELDAVAAEQRVADSHIPTPERKEERLTDEHIERLRKGSVYLCFPSEFSALIAELQSHRAAAGREEIIEGEKLCECVVCGRMHRHLGTPPSALSHNDLCHLSIAWGKHTDYRTSSDIRVNEWLKKLIALKKDQP